MAPSFRDAFNSLTVGAISKPFEFEGNTVILRVAQVKGANLRPLEEVADDIESILKRQQRKLRKREYIQSLRAQNYVKIFFKTPMQPKKKG
jgi:parvulin-like peptidyl-prolyl isomerase